MAKKIIFDTDPGVDDTFALYLALNSPEIEVAGITTIFGNSTVEKTTRNTLYCLERFNCPHIPVAQGAAKPMSAPWAGPADFVHGDEGLGDFIPSKPKKQVVSNNAAQWLVDTINKHPNEYSIAAVGPLTNLGLALQIDPNIVNLVKEVVIMGGAVNVSGNVTPAAEANIYNDPHAADLVFAAKWPVTMMGLDVTEQLMFSEELLNQLHNSDDPDHKFLAQISRFYKNYYAKTRGFTGMVAHDVTAIAYFINRDFFEYQTGAIRVVTDGFAQGMTIFDRRNNWNFEHPWSDRKPIKLATKINAPAILDCFKINEHSSYANT